MLGCSNIQGYYTGRPMPADKVIRFAQSFNLPDDMVQWKDITLKMEDFPVALAYTQHNDQISKVLEFNKSEGVSVNAEKIKNWKECPFGKWYYGVGVKYEKIGEYKEIGRVHKKIHKFAYKNLRLTLEGEFDEADRLVYEIENICGELKRHLFNLAKIIAKA